jgi:hypothetical protein
MQVQMPGTDASSLMALADVRSGASALIPGTQATILCCTCGAPMVWNPASMCANCIRTRVDITEGIPKSVPMQCCRACGRFLNPPKHWVACQPESKELLSICLKRIKGLNKVKLIDASFIWTEPHCRRLKVRLHDIFVLIASKLTFGSGEADCAKRSLQRSYPAASICC